MDKISQIKKDLGMSDEGTPGKPETDQPDIHDDREESDDGATGTKNMDNAREYDYFCPIHRTIVSGNICPGAGDGKHQIDDRWMVKREEKSDKVAAKDMDFEASITNMRGNMGGKSIKDLEKALEDPNNRRLRLDLIKQDLTNQPNIEKAIKSRIATTIEVKKEQMKKRVDDFAKSIKSHVTAIEKGIGRDKVVKILGKIQSINENIHKAIDKNAMKLAMSGVGLLGEFAKLLPGKPEDTQDMSKGLPPAPSKEKPLEEHKIEHAHRTPPTGYPETESQYADPKNKKYPIDSAKHVRAAMAYFSKPKNYGMYTPEERKTMWARILKAAKKHGVEASEATKEEIK